MTIQKVSLPREVDGIFIGGGHNALVAASYLGRAGARVLVLESQPKIGGGLATEEITLPLFKHNLQTFFVRWTPDYRIWKDLKLSRYGLETFVPMVQKGVPFREGGGLVTYNSIEKSVADIRKLNPCDAETYAQLYAEFGELTQKIMGPLSFAPPLPFDELEALLSRSKLGRRCLELSRYAALDLVRELFKDEAIRALILYNISVFGCLPFLDMPGTGQVVSLALFNAHHSGLVKGGSHEAARALTASVFDSGGMSVTGAKVERILVEQGRATGVELSDGRCIRARKFVCSNLAPAITLGRLLEPQYLDSDLHEAVTNYRWSDEAIFGVHLALREPPRYRSVAPDSPLQQALNCCIGYETSQDFERHMGWIRSRTIPEEPAFQACVPSRFDPSQAPPGYTTAFIWEFVPSRPVDGGPERWDGPAAETFAELMINKWREYAPNLAEAELAWAVHSPRDTERHVPSMILGDRFHGSAHPDNVGANRPHPRLSDYRTPIEGLYHCGASMHPGAGFSGQPGYNAATVIAQDLGYELWWRPRNPRSILVEL